MDTLLILACSLLLYLGCSMVARWLVRRERAACQARAARAAQREAETLQSYRVNTIPGRNGRVGDTTTTPTPWDAFVPTQAADTPTPLPAVPHVYSSPSLVGGGGEFSGAGASGGWAPSSCGGSDYSSSSDSGSSCSSSSSSGSH